MLTALTWCTVVLFGLPCKQHTHTHNTHTHTHTHTEAIKATQATQVTWVT
jgi:hypothetical protein